ncbi:hypothetical protein A8C56_15290 [Niabella ginsenosidivorans]|uniref:Uncharacterized protein n=1 Tax=Niabella ginsenosidivorans TaxID=1176587 RepID=A0A1A9I667_9BACT|nr:hypothetical protein A8C56_15290 [Niabella ginsenosidivorans]
MLLFSGLVYSQEKMACDSLSGVLETIYVKDQKPRDTLNRLMKQFGYNSDTVNRYWNHVKEMDSLNALQVTKIIDRYGWLPQQKISPMAAQALYIVIQHAPAIQEKYLPVLKKAIDRGFAKKEYYAYMYDRIQMFHNKYQLYGTQYGSDRSGKTVLWPVKNAVQLNVRRKLMGLGTIEEQSKGMEYTFINPAIDSLKNRIVFFGNVENTRQQPVPDVAIYDSEKQCLGRTDRLGYFKIVPDKSALKNGIYLKKKIMR